MKIPPKKIFSVSKVSLGQYSEKGILECYSDADFGWCTKTGRSTSKVVVKYAEGVISMLSQIAGTSIGAELIAATDES